MSSERLQEPDRSYATLALRSTASWRSRFRCAMFFFYMSLKTLLTHVYACRSDWLTLRLSRGVFRRVLSGKMLIKLDDLFEEITFLLLLPVLVSHPGFQSPERCVEYFFVFVLKTRWTGWDPFILPPITNQCFQQLRNMVFLMMVRSLFFFVILLGNHFKAVRSVRVWLIPPPSKACS